MPPRLRRLFKELRVPAWSKWLLRDLPGATGCGARSAWFVRPACVMGILQRLGRKAGTATRNMRAGDAELAWHRVAHDLSRSLEVTSPAFTDGGQLPRTATVEGGGLPVPIQWSSAPEGAQGLALVCEDPDAPLPEPFVHWLVAAIPPDAHAVGSGSSFVEGKNSTRQVGFTPAAPPHGHGVHHYHFQVFALDVRLDLEPGFDRSELLDAMDGHVLTWGDLVGTYQRT